MTARDPLTEEEIRAMLAYVPAGERETWVRMGMAVKAELGDAGFDLWDAWSQSADNYDARAARDTWRSIKDGPVGIGTLVHLAKENGWQPDRPMPATRRLANPAHAQDSRAPEKPAEPSPTQALALRLWAAADRDDAVVAAHPYAVSKGITHAAGAGRVQATGSVIGKDADCLVIPIRTDAIGDVQAVQVINPEGKKQTFGPIRGGCLILGNTLHPSTPFIGNTLDPSAPWYVCEGWASAVSVVFHHLKGNAVCGVAFGKSNLDQTAAILARVFDPHEILILEEQ
jgi:hypothetical protein